MSTMYTLYTYSLCTLILIIYIYNHYKPHHTNCNVIVYGHCVYAHTQLLDLTSSMLAFRFFWHTNRQLVSMCILICFVEYYGMTI